MLDGLDALFANGKPKTLVAQSGAGASINENGPVGVYIRNTREVVPGYQSLKNWEQKTGFQCKLVVTVGAYDNIARFVKEARDHGEEWIISAVSFTGADKFSGELQRLGVTENIIMSQVVPLLDSDLPIVNEARGALGADFGFVTQGRGARFDLGGLAIDFTRNGYQGSDLVVVSHLTDAGYRDTDAKAWKRMLSWRPHSADSAK